MKVYFVSDLRVELSDVEIWEISQLFFDPLGANFGLARSTRFKFRLGPIIKNIFQDTAESRAPVIIKKK